jgi:hypothetical protein
MMARKVTSSDQLFKGRHFGRDVIVLCVHFFKVFKWAAVTIAGIELLHRIQKGQFDLRSLGVQGQAVSTVRTAVLSA